MNTSTEMLAQLKIDFSDDMYPEQVERVVNQVESDYEYCYGRRKDILFMVKEYICVYYRRSIALNSNVMKFLDVVIQRRKDQGKKVYEYEYGGSKFNSDYEM